MGVPPPGDFRNCLAALSDDESLTAQLLQYRFAQGEGLDGHAFGNLFITAMADVSGSFERGLIESSHVLAITGRILPSTLNDVTISAEIKTDRGLMHVDGETAITHSNGMIERVILKPADARAYPETIRAILEADDAHEDDKQRHRDPEAARPARAELQRLAGNSKAPRAGPPAAT